MNSFVGYLLLVSNYRTASCNGAAEVTALQVAAELLASLDHPSLSTGKRQEEDG